jgi:hypothetical protein
MVVVLARDQLPVLRPAVTETAGVPSHVRRRERIESIDWRSLVLERAHMTIFQEPIMEGNILLWVAYSIVRQVRHSGTSAYADLA